MYRIPFSGPSFEPRTYEFHVDDTFFAAFNYEEITHCDININVHLEKTERFLKLDIHFSGDYFVPCDRCLDPIQTLVNHDEQLIVNFGMENDFDSEVWTISAKEHELNLETFIYETLVLLRPFSAMHDIKNCNPKMLAQLQAPPASKPDNDPRWDALKSLMNKE